MQAKKRQGRKPSAKPYQQGVSERVVYYRRVAPGLVGKLDEVLDGKLPVVTTPTPSVVALLEDVDRLTKQVAELTAERDGVVNGCPDATVVRLRCRVTELEARVRDLESFGS